MNKIICDICGTSYPDTSESCPICGCSRDSADEFLNAEAVGEDVAVDAAGEVAATAKKKEIFDFDVVNAPRPVKNDAKDEDEEDDDEDDYDEEEDDDDEPRSNTFIVILLTVLIVVLLGAAAFIFFRFFLPGRNAEPTTPTAVVQELPETTAATEAGIPCDHIAMSNQGVAELNAEGQQFLLHVRVFPENTTDKIFYTSADESVATVTEDGKITAIAEGETVITITCGEYHLDCPVIVKYEEETVPTTEAVEETEPTEETVAEDATGAAEETVPETTAEAGPISDSNVTLKLKKTDIQLGVYYQFQLVLDCDLKPEDVTWTSEHPHIATVDEKGNVTAVKDGTTAITAKYGSQEVQCIVRCVWY